MHTKVELPMNQERFCGFDYLRISMALAVVALHTHVLCAYRFSIILAFGIPVCDILENNLLRLAVPTFLLMSLFLFASKADRGSRYLLRRLEWLMLLFVFWSGLFWVVFRGNHGLFGHDLPMSGWKASTTWVFKLLVTGGNPYYYFFSCLALLVLLSFLARRFPRWLLWLCVIASTGFLWVMAVLALHNDALAGLTVYWNPLNFLPFAFIAPLMSSYWHQGYLQRPMVRLALIVVLILLCVPIACMEWQHLADSSATLPGYTRPSLVLGASALVLVALPVSHPAPAVVRLLSDYSLGIYCVHSFVRLFLPRQTPGDLAFLVITGISIAVTAFVRYSIGKRMI